MDALFVLQGHRATRQTSSFLFILAGRPVTMLQGKQSTGFQISLFFDFFLIFWIFLDFFGFFGPRRVPEGSGGAFGFIWTKFQPKWSHFGPVGAHFRFLIF